MRFRSLIAATPILTCTKADPEITRLTLYSKEVRPGSLFFCVRGFHADGHEYATEAYRHGCRAFIAEKALFLPSDAAVALVPNARLALADVAAAFYDYPIRKMQAVGVGGTKGKTTVSVMISALLSAAGVRTGLVGSLGAFCAGNWIPTANTTPESVELQRILYEMCDLSVEVPVIEVSSQSLAVGRVRGLAFPTAVLTGLGYDHVGKSEHKDLYDYWYAKRTLYTDYGAEKVIYPVCDRSSALLLRGVAAEKTAVGEDSRADIYARDGVSRLENGVLTERFDLVRNGEVTPVCLPLPGRFNITNACLAVGAADAALSRLGKPLLSGQKIAEVLGEIRVPGHTEVYPAADGRLFLVDYAHNGKSMEALLTLLRRYRPSRLTVLFGSVGERSYARRAELAAVVSSLADFAVLTSDNPGNEDAEAIAAEIREAMPDFPSVTVADRREAVYYAVRHSCPNEICALCGKGAEKTQKVGGSSFPYSESEILSEAISECGLQI